MLFTQDQINRVDSDDGRTYEVRLGDGKVVVFPSVTTVIGKVLDKPALPPWAFNIGVEETYNYLRGQKVFPPTWQHVKAALYEEDKTHNSRRDSGGDRGTRLHLILEDIINGRSYSVEPEDKPYVDELKNWIKMYNPQWHETEQKVASMIHGYAGTFDAICTIRKHPPRKRHKDLTGKIVMIDLKTNKGGKVYPFSHLPQIEAYRAAWTEMDGMMINEAAVVGIGEGSQQTCVSYDTIDHYLAIHNLYKQQLKMQSANPNGRK